MKEILSSAEAQPSWIETVGRAPIVETGDELLFYRIRDYGDTHGSKPSTGNPARTQYSAITAIDGWALSDVSLAGHDTDKSEFARSGVSVLMLGIGRHHRK